MNAPDEAYRALGANHINDHEQRGGDRAVTGAGEPPETGRQQRGAEDDHPGTAATANTYEDNSLGRLLALSDGVFAIAMTLLALDLRVPELGDTTTNAALAAALAAQLPTYLSYLISFYVVARYWRSHHRLMRSVTSAHARLLTPTLLLLLLVGVLPFPSSLLGRYGGDAIALAVYGAVNVLAVATLLWLRRVIRILGLASRPANTRESAGANRDMWGTIVIFLLCIPAGYILGSHGPYVLLLLLIWGRGGAWWQRWQQRRQAAA